MKPTWCAIAVLLVSATTAKGHDFATTRVFRSGLSAGNMTTLTRSKGRGDAEFVLDLATLKLRYTIDFEGLSSGVTQIDLHGPAEPGTNAPPFVTLTGKSGEVAISEAQVQYMLQGWTYCLVATRVHPNGEIRGKLQAVDPRTVAPRP